MRIHPALLVDSIEELQHQVDAVKDFVDEVDVDIIDWIRHERKTLTAKEALQVNFYDLKVNFDLMLDFPSQSIDLVIEDPRVNMVIINLESDEDTIDLIKKVKAKEKFVGISMNPESKFEDIDYMLILLEHIQIMTVEPGAQGNSFLPDRLELVDKIKATDYNGTVGTDGSFNEDTLKAFVEHEIDIVSVGSAISKAVDPKKAYEDFMRKIEKYKTV